MIGEAREGGEGNICCWKGAGVIGVVSCFHPCSRCCLTFPLYLCLHFHLLVIVLQCYSWKMAKRIGFAGMID